jgi:rfaE bifunctional protein nucleotidyltransferase chain/domain
VTPPADKLRDLDDLANECAGWREQGITVVLANGAFDLLHVGHVRYLDGARELGDRLVVAVNSDFSVRLSKGSLRPILPEAERVEMLSHLWMVDRLCLFDDQTVAPVIELLRPAIHAKGTDYTVATVPERTVVMAYGGRTAIVGDPKEHATTDLIATIIERFGTRLASFPPESIR